MKRIEKLALVLILLASTSPLSASAQEQREEPYNYDMRFLDRDSHKPSNPFTLSGNDFHKHSYRRMLLNSPYGSSSIGLGANSQKQIFNKDAYDYMNPNSKKINQPTASPELDPYIDNAYGPKINKHYTAGYDTNKDFNEPNPFEQQALPQTLQKPMSNYGQAFSPAGGESRFMGSNNPFDSTIKNPTIQAVPFQNRNTPRIQQHDTNVNSGPQTIQDQILPSFLNSPASNNQFRGSNPGF